MLFMAPENAMLTLLVFIFMYLQLKILHSTYGINKAHSDSDQKEKNKALWKMW